MPTYQYSCTDCGHFYEIVQSFSDDSLTVCPECEGRLRKVFNAVGVVFKGSASTATTAAPKVGARRTALSEGSEDQGRAATPARPKSAEPAGEQSTSGTPRRRPPRAPPPPAA